MKIPLHLLVLDAIGALAAGVGLWGALAGGGATLPLLANPRVAWSIVAIGVLLMAYAGVELVRIALHRRSPKAPGEE
jgi:hypothetical protein